MSAHEQTGASGFNPDWTVAPGSTLREWREEQHLPVKALARLCSMTVDHYEHIEAGRLRIGQITACKLAQGTGIPARFWLNFEHLYRDGLAAGKKVA